MRYSADEQSSRLLTVIHRYYITNEGPSIVPKTYVNITVPISMKEVVYAKIKVNTYITKYIHTIIVCM